MPMQVKRQALDAKAGIPVFNPAAYQQLAYAPATAGAAPTYVPVSCKYIVHMLHFHAE